MDALACISDEGRSKATISDGEVPSNLRPVDLRMRKLSQFTDYLNFAFRCIPGEVKHFSTQRNRN